MDTNKKSSKNRDDFDYGYTTKPSVKAKERRRKEAAFRQYEHESLTIQERIDKAKSRRGESKKEIARLTSLLPKDWDKAMEVSKKPSSAPKKKPRTSKRKVVEAAKKTRPSKS